MHFYKNDNRVGTGIFMAREVLLGFDADQKFLTNHDLESAYYLAIWGFAGYRGSKKPAINGKVIDPLWSWRVGTHEDMCAAKEKYMGQSASVDACLVLGIPMPNESVEYDIDMIRLQYKRRLLRAEEEEMAREKEIINEIVTQARKSGLSYKESSEKVMKLLGESEGRKAHRSTAISYKEMMKGVGVKIQNEKNVTCKCCVD